MGGLAGFRGFVRAVSTRENRELMTLAIALVLGMSTWFSTTAVLADLRLAWELSATEGSLLTIVVQVGFVVGAVVSSVTNLADRVAPLRLILVGTTGAAVANASIVITDAYGPALAARAATGACLALVYPPALKAMTSRQ